MRNSESALSLSINFYELFAVASLVISSDSFKVETATPSYSSDLVAPSSSPSAPPPPPPSAPTAMTSVSGVESAGVGPACLGMTAKVVVASSASKDSEAELGHCGILAREKEEEEKGILQ